MSKSKKVILFIESSRGFGRSLLRGIAKYSSLFGPWTFYQRPFFYLDKSFSAQSRKSEFEHLKKWGAQGVIAREFSVTTRAEILSLGIPAVISTVFDKQLEKNVGNIYVENYGIGYMAAEYLMERGFRNFAFCGWDDFFWSRERAKGFSECVRRAGHRIFLYQQPKSRQKRLWDFEQHILGDWLCSLPRPTGLMACIDERAQDIIQTCKQVNIHIPEEIAVIGGDNDELICELSNPQLSSVAINGEQGGYEAAKLLDELMRQNKPQDMTVTVRPTHVVTRYSTDITAVQDPEVAGALRYISTHVRDPIQVNDVAGHVAMTRQGLNKKFKKCLNRTIHDEIIRIRIQQIARMLIETNMSVSNIAQSMGYTELKYISRLFRRQTGLSPLQYRNKYRIK